VQTIEKRELHRVSFKGDMPETMTPDQRRKTAELLVSHAESDMLYRGATLWSMLTFYTGIVIGLLAAAVGVAGLSAPTIPIWIRCATVFAIAALGSLFAAAGRYSLSIESFYFVRIRRMRNRLLKAIVAGEDLTDLEVHREVMEIRPETLSEFRTGAVADGDSTKALRSCYLEDLGKEALSENGVRWAMQMAVAVLGVASGVVAAGAAVVALLPVNTAAALLCGGAVILGAVLGQWVVLRKLRRNLGMPPRGWHRRISVSS
jgi:hypothetical protein